MNVSGQQPDELGLVLVVAAVLLLMMALFLFSFFSLLRPWVRAFASGGQVPIFSIIGMRLRGNPPLLLIDAYATLRRAGRDIKIADVERTYMDSRTRIRQSSDLVDLIESRLEDRQA